ncbi:phosphotransferase enzyme family protein [Nocardia asteroides]|uniref:phosphotransferase enzyme family protein n=1 Tax=Nocardia asteroides TaxID=1824 RepID=UPI0037C54F8E
MADNRRFDPALMTAVAREASADAGLSSEGIELLRLGQNLMYLLPEEGVVVRIARKIEFLATAHKEITVATWLRQQGFAAASAARDHPRVVHGHPVTFWDFVGGRVSDESHLAQLGALLARFHGLAWPASLELPNWDPLAQLAQRIDAAAISLADKTLLFEKAADLQARLPTLSYQLPAGVNHGDAHIKNVIITPEGVSVLLDFENVCRGPREWDLAKVATEAEMGMVSPERYRDFADAYGHDVRAWDGFDVVRSVMQLRMITWIAQNVEHSRSAADEFAKRITTLRTGQLTEAWSGF